MLGPLNIIPASLERIRSLPRRFSFYFLAAVGSLALWTFAAERTLESRTRAGQSMQGSFAAIAEIERLASMLKNAETGQRGYLLTFDPRYLDSYVSGRTGTGAVLERLSRMTREEPDQQIRLRALGPLIEQKFAELGETIDLKLMGENENVLDLVKSDSGRQKMVEIDQLIQELSAAELSLLDRNREQIERARRRTMEIVIGGGALVSLLILFVGLIVRRDTAELARLTQERQETLLALDAQFRLLSNVVEQVPVRLIVREVPGREVLFSNAAQNTPSNPRVLLAQSETLRRSDGSLYPPGQSPSERAEQTARESADEEAQLLLPDGSIRLLLVRAAPVVDRDGRVVATVEVGDDITERKRDEDLRENLMAIVGHDLRNPLSAICTSAGILGGNAELRPEIRHQVAAQMLSSARRMDRIISLLLDYTRAQSRGLQVDPREADLTAICDSSLEEVLLPASDKRIDRRVHGATRGFWDVDRLGQVVSNLVTNAVKYGEGGQPVIIDLDGTDADAVHLRVRNRGRPIAPESLPYLFEPFYIGPQTESTVRRSMGLGLYIVKEIVVAHGGTIHVTSGLEEGTEFAVTLPRDSRQESHGAPDSSARAAS